MTAGFNGMNGTIIRNTIPEGITLGRVSGEPYGYAASTTLAVTVDVRVERAERRETYETITHGEVSAPLDFGISAGVWNPRHTDTVAGGQCVDVLGELVTFSPGWNADSVAELRGMWDRWHLNGMRAACAHMPESELIREPDRYSPSGTRIACGSVNTCPVNGTYTYGASWLVEPLPDSFLADLDRLFAVPIERSQFYRHPSTIGTGDES